jgi:predicted transcriptional regulator
MKLVNISTATNRLTNLAKAGVARRVEHRPVSGGGREYVYAAVK